MEVTFQAVLTSAQKVAVPLDLQPWKVWETIGRIPRDVADEQARFRRGPSRNYRRQAEP